MNSFLHEDGSSLPICDSPMQSIIEGGFKYCKYHCQPDEYLYFNGSCLQECLTPFQARSNVDRNKFCLNPCSNDPQSYLYSDGSCLKSCGSPMNAIVQGGANLCQNPCNDVSLYYIEGLWRTQCPSLYIEEQTKFYKVCKLGNNMQTLDTMQSVTVKAASVGLTATSLTSLGSSRGVTIAVLARMF